MYPPPPTQIVKALIGNELVTVAFGIYVIHLSFLNGNRVSVAAPFRFGERTLLHAMPVNDFPLEESQLMRVLGCRIVSIACEKDGTLEIGFDNKDAIVIYGDNPKYEVYTLLIDGKEFVV